MGKNHKKTQQNPQDTTKNTHQEQNAIRRQIRQNEALQNEEEPTTIQPEIMIIIAPPDGQKNATQDCNKKMNNIKNNEKNQERKNIKDKRNSRGQNTETNTRKRRQKTTETDNTNGHMDTETFHSRTTCTILRGNPD